jgi:hypothetical protein
MRWIRYLAVLGTAAVLVTLSGALKGPVLSLGSPVAAEDIDEPDPPPEDAAAWDTDPEAAALLDEAAAALDAPKVRWLETAVWQKVRLPELAFEAEGRYVLAPGKRFRLELTTRVGEGRAAREGGLLTVSDGATLYHATRAGAGGWEAAGRQPLEEALLEAEVAAESPEFDGLLPHGPAVRGVAPLLRDLHRRLRWVRRERLAGGTAVRLTGVWPRPSLQMLAPPHEPWPEGLPRCCRLTLHARTSWPQRVEWWGPTPGRPGDRLLAQMEFRDPVLNRSFSARRQAAEFTFDPRCPLRCH